MAPQDLRKLPAEERLKKLKQLEQEKRKEIEEARQQILESESEITEKKKWVEKVPIPEVAKEELEGLSEEGKQLLKTHKGVKAEPSAEIPERGEPQVKKAALPGRGASRLEETIQREKSSLPPQAMGAEYGAATAKQAFGVEYKPAHERPTTELYQEMSSLRQSAENKGYVSKADERRAEYLTGIVEERLEAANKGAYSFTEETARAASVTQMLAHSIKEAYKKGGSFEHDWYKGR